MDSNPKGPYLLKLLAGPNQGAEIALNEETLIIGSGDTADVVLSDSLVAAEHLQVHIENEAITITALAPGIAYENRILDPNKPQELSLFKPVGLGTSYFVVGPQNAAWPEFSLDELLKQGKKEAQEKESRRLAGKIRNLSDVKLYSLIGFIAIIFGLLFLTWILPNKEAHEPINAGKGIQSPSSKNVSIRELKIYLDTLTEEKGLKVETSSAGLLQLTGYVKTFQERLDIEKWLRPYRRQVRVQLVDEESILNSSKELLSMLKVSMVPSILPQGGLKLSGYASSEEAFDAFKLRLMQDIPGVKYIEGELLTDKDIVEKAKTLLAEKGLEDKILIGIQNDTLMFVGYISEQQDDAWTQAYTQVRHKLSSYLGVSQNVRALKDKDFLHWVFGDQVDSITASKNRWVSLINGQKLFEGAVLEQDYILSSIEDDRLIITKGSTRLTFVIN